MDPTNSATPTPTPAPTPTPTPTPAPTPAPTPTTTPPAPATPPAPEAPVAPVTPPAPEAPVAPVTPEPVTPLAAPVSPINPNPVNPVFQPTGQSVADTDPIMMPEPAPAPDPIEEELKAPMKAAGPAPGSIGSAVSGPKEEILAGGTIAPDENPFNNNPKAPTPSVPFNDPASSTDAEVPGQAPSDKPKAKANNKTLMIILSAVLGVIVLVLIIILIMQFLGGGSPAPSGGSSNNSESALVDDNSKADDGNTAINQSGVDGTSSQTIASTLTCTKNMTAEKLANIEGASSGTIKITAGFDSNNGLVNVKKVETVIYSDEETSTPEQLSSTSANYVDLDGTTAKSFDLPVSENGNILSSLENVQMNYESLDYICEVL